MSLRNIFQRKLTLQDKIMIAAIITIILTSVCVFICTFFGCRVGWEKCSSRSECALFNLAFISGFVALILLLASIGMVYTLEKNAINKYENGELKYNKVERITIVNDKDTVRAITFEKAE